MSMKSSEYLYETPLLFSLIESKRRSKEADRGETWRTCTTWQHLWAPALSFRMVPPRVDSLRYAKHLGFVLAYSRRVFTCDRTLLSFVPKLDAHAALLYQLLLYSSSPRASIAPPPLAASLCSNHLFLWNTQRRMYPSNTCRDSCPFDGCRSKYHVNYLRPEDLAER